MEKDDQVLLAQAITARSRAYAPYSHFTVGAAVRTADGQVFTAGNIENASYGLTVCAERVALFAAIAAGHSHFQALAVAADTSKPVAPCGACRQVMAEFGVEQIIMGNVQGDCRVMSLTELLPNSFASDVLPGGK